MNKEFDYEVNRLLHTVTYALDDFSKAEEEFYKAKKQFHDRSLAITVKLKLAKQEIFELIRIKGEEDNTKEVNMNDGEKKIIEGYLSDKPKIQNRGGWWNKALSIMVVMAKAYLRYEAMKYKNG